MREWGAPLSESFNLWLKGCEANNTIIWLLDGSGETALYKTQNQFLYKNNYYYSSPVYHVWINGERIVATESYLSALEIWVKNNKIPRFS